LLANLNELRPLMQRIEQLLLWLRTCLTPMAGTLGRVGPP
jgi:hypothetical protein